MTADAVDEIFRTTGQKRKAEFSLEFAAELSQRLSDDQPVTVPEHFRELFEFLYSEDGAGADPFAADA